MTTDLEKEREAFEAAVFDAIDAGIKIAFDEAASGGEIFSMQVYDSICETLRADGVIARAALAVPAAPQEQPSDAALTQALKDRDDAEDMADQLAAQIAAITGEEIGEHTSANDPWRNAMLAADDFIAEQIRKLCSAPAKQPAPQAGEDAAGQVEHLDVENHRLRRAMRKIMARLTDLLDEDQFGNIESIVKEAGVEPPEPAGEDAQPVGEAGTMPGTSGFTMACFKASDVPVGSLVYAAPIATPEHDAKVRDAVLEEAAQQCIDIYSWKGAFRAGLLSTPTLEACAKAIRSLKSTGADHAK